MLVRASSVVCLLLAAPLTGCLDGGTEPEAPVSVYLTAEGLDEFQEVHVNISGAHVREEDNRTTNTTGHGGDTKRDLSTPGSFSEHRDEGSAEQVNRFEEAAGWHEIFSADERVGVGFHDQAQDQATFLGEADVTQTSFVEAGLLIHSVTALDQNGSQVDVTVTDEIARAEVGFEVTSDHETRLVLVLDVGESLNRSEDRGWRFSPNFTDVRAEAVDDGASGEERHERGQAVRLGS